MKKIIINTFYLLTICITFLGCSKSDDAEPEINLRKPIASQATDINYSSFIANWARVYKAEKYELDVSESENFNSFISGYNAKNLSNLYEEITNLNQGTTYYYRIRAINGIQVSENSNTISVTTLEEGSVGLTAVLKDKATTFYVGVAVMTSRLSGKYDEIFTREFSSVTAEYEMKMNIILPQKGEYDWSRSDAIVNYAQENNLNVHGHALVWHQSTPNWLENYDGTDEEFEEEVKNYITEVLTRYKGKVKSWDVVNEGVNDSGGTLRNSVFKQRMGDDYIAKCFQFAREADPDVLLFYNDYSMCENQTKQNAVFDLVDDFQTRNIPIDGVGFQMHIRYNGPSKSQIETATDRIVERNLLAHFSEVDVRVNPNNDISQLTTEREDAQKAKVKEVVQIYNAIPIANKYAITIWGLKDNDSWIMDLYGHSDWPLLFNSSYTAKKAHAGFLEGLE